ncbi:MAG: hypothetical protein HZT43_08965 [Exiguobacterium profundum]|nr:MAG: hypothetical protein HZT43_08965 [Exiguobacterium profundum]
MAGNRDRLSASGDGATLTGGASGDLFIFKSPELGPTLITDFESGLDRFILAAFYAAGYEVPGQLADDRLSFGAASGSQGQFVLSYDAKHGCFDPGLGPQR